MITLEDVKNNHEVIALIEGSQKQLDKLRIYRTWNKTYKFSFKKGRRYFTKITDILKE